MKRNAMDSVDPATVSIIHVDNSAQLSVRNLPAERSKNLTYADLHGLLSGKTIVSKRDQINQIVNTPQISKAVLISNQNACHNLYLSKARIKSRQLKQPKTSEIKPSSVNVKHLSHTLPVTAAPNFESLSSSPLNNLISKRNNAIDGKIVHPNIWNSKVVNVRKPSKSKKSVSLKLPNDLINGQKRSRLDDDLLSHNKITGNETEEKTIRKRKRSYQKNISDDNVSISCDAFNFNSSLFARCNNSYAKLSAGRSLPLSAYKEEKKNKISLLSTSNFNDSKDLSNGLLKKTVVLKREQFSKVSKSDKESELRCDKNRTVKSFNTYSGANGISFSKLSKSYQDLKSRQQLPNSIWLSQAKDAIHTPAARNLLNTIIQPNNAIQNIVQSDVSSESDEDSSCETAMDTIGGVWLFDRESSSDDESTGNLSLSLMRSKRNERLENMRKILRCNLALLDKCHCVNQPKFCKQYEVSQSLVEAAYCDPASAAQALSVASDLLSKSSFGSEKSSKTPQERRPSLRICLFIDDSTKCSAPALPYANHCVKHIMYNVDQQLFEFCTARLDDGVQCCTPVFDPLHDMPLCTLHHSTLQQQQASGSVRVIQQKKAARRTNRRKRKYKRRSIGGANNVANKHNALAVSSGDKLMQKSSHDECVPLVQHETASHMSSETFVRDLGLSVEKDDDHKLLDDHDFNEVLGRLPDSFHMFEGKNGTFLSSKDEVDALASIFSEVQDGGFLETHNVVDDTARVDFCDDLLVNGLNDEGFIGTDDSELLEHEEISAEEGNMLHESELSSLASSFSLNDMKQLSKVLTPAMIDSMLQGDQLTTNGLNRHSLTMSPSAKLSPSKCSVSPVSIASLPSEVIHYRGSTVLSVAGPSNTNVPSVSTSNDFLKVITTGNLSIVTSEQHFKMSEQAAKNNALKNIMFESVDTASSSNHNHPLFDACVSSHLINNNCGTNKSYVSTQTPNAVCVSTQAPMCASTAAFERASAQALKCSVMQVPNAVCTSMQAPMYSDTQAPNVVCSSTQASKYSSAQALKCTSTQASNALYVSKKVSNASTIYIVPQLLSSNTSSLSSLSQSVQSLQSIQMVDEPVVNNSKKFDAISNSKSSGQPYPNINTSVTIKPNQLANSLSSTTKQSSVVNLLSSSLKKFSPNVNVQPKPVMKLSSSTGVSSSSKLSAILSTCASASNISGNSQKQQSSSSPSNNMPPTVLRNVSSFSNAAAKASSNVLALNNATVKISPNFNTLQMFSNNLNSRSTAVTDTFSPTTSLHTVVNNATAANFGSINVLSNLCDQHNNVVIRDSHLVDCRNIGKASESNVVLTLGQSSVLVNGQSSLIVNGRSADHNSQQFFLAPVHAIPGLGLVYLNNNSIVSQLPVAEREVSGLETIGNDKSDVNSILKGYSHESGAVKIGVVEKLNSAGVGLTSASSLNTTLTITSQISKRNC